MGVVSGVVCIPWCPRVSTRGFLSWVRHNRSHKAPLEASFQLAGVEVAGSTGSAA
jgi:hypothetical protein